LRASQLGARLFRRNIGQGWIGQATKYTRSEMVPVNPGDVLIRQARPFHSGVPGQYDTEGWRTITITADMVGQRIAQHVEIEAKQGTGRESTEQRAWGEAVRAAGGVAGVARTVEDVDRLLSAGPIPR
jgi:hypothetical protein